MNPAEVIYTVLTAQHADRTAAEIATGADLPESEVTAALTALAESGKVVAIDHDRFVSDIAAKRLVDTARKTLSAFHKRNPYRRGISIGDLHAALKKAAIVRDFNALLVWLGAQGIVARDAKTVRLCEHSITLPPHWQAATDTMLPVFVAGGLIDPPWPGNFRANFPRDILVTVILDALAERGELIRLADDLYISIEAMEAARVCLIALTRAGEPITVGTVRDRTGSSRRVIVPLLEWFDQQGVTERRGEEHVLMR